MSEDTVNAPLVRVVSYSWREIVDKALGKEKSKPEPAYEFSNGRTFEDNPRGGAYEADE